MLPIASASIVGGRNGVIGLLGVVGLAASLGFIGFIDGVRSGCPEPAGRPAGRPGPRQYRNDSKRRRRRRPGDSERPGPAEGDVILHMYIISIRWTEVVVGGKLRWDGRGREGRIP